MALLGKYYAYCRAYIIFFQKICKYAEKSTVSNRCMHFIEAIGGHCDCAAAQRELRKAVSKDRSR